MSKNIISRNGVPVQKKKKTYTIYQNSEFGHYALLFCRGCQNNKINALKEEHGFLIKLFLLIVITVVFCPTEVSTAGLRTVKGNE